MIIFDNVKVFFKTLHKIKIMPKEEIELILQLQQWDLDSFTPLYEKYFQKIYSFALIKSNWNTQQAEDATANTFMKAFENINKFSVEKEGSSFAAWIYNIAYHSLLDIIKRKESDKLEDQSIISDDTNYIDYFQKHVQTEQILAYLEQLWTDKKDLFVLRIRENLSYDEIAEVLWKRSSTCRKDFSKLVKKVANHFKYWLED